MTIAAEIAVLQRYNAWRRGEKVDQPASITIGHAIDEVSQAARRYETLRSLNVNQFSELVRRNLNGGNFDQLVDELGSRKT